MNLINGRPARIAGTGKYIPEKVMRNSDFEKILDTNDKWIVERTGIKERHFAEQGQKCSDLAYNAAILAIEDSGLTAEDIDMVLVGTNSPDSAFPSVASPWPAACRQLPRARAPIVLPPDRSASAALQALSPAMAMGSNSGKNASLRNSLDLYMRSKILLAAAE